MNEKYIWELWSKCKHPHPEYGGGDMIWPMEFAELIIRECMGICYRTDTEYEGHKVKSTVIASKVAEHFGVEE